MAEVRPDMPWIINRLRKDFPNYTLWINFCPVEGCHMLYFGKYGGPQARDFVANSFPIELTDEGIETARVKLSLVL
jgi:hypothetical protein